jgi:hypothetical protein
MLSAALDLKDVALKGVSLELAPVRLREVMDEIEARWQPRAAAAGVTLLVAYDGDPTPRPWPTASACCRSSTASSARRGRPGARRGGSRPLRLSRPRIRAPGRPHPRAARRRAGTQGHREPASARSRSAWAWRWRSAPCCAAASWPAWTASCARKPTPAPPTPPPSR